MPPHLRSLVSSRAAVREIGVFQASPLIASITSIASTTSLAPLAPRTPHASPAPLTPLCSTCLYLLHSLVTPLIIITPFVRSPHLLDGGKKGVPTRDNGWSVFCSTTSVNLLDMGGE
ncbi:hypothetical protein BCR39DRAFT_69609 [Naematelia encephala]|uniref:Uncharacterized protein n=1 Tax=Naematelia encephala TaxID=71784 RepID=A0A1Y2BAS1_9TREE|nr:hypothetical protein BCR39DRAFT_69609 [Naematelia encephala]